MLELTASLICSVVMAREPEMLPVCSVNRITKNCTIFNETDEFIALPGGRRFPNYNYVRPEEGAASIPEVSANSQSADYQNQLLENQFKILDILNASEKKFSERFKQHMMGLSPFERKALREPNSVARELYIYRPADSENGKIEVVDSQEFHQFMSATFTAEEIAQLGAVGLTPRNPMAEQREEQKQIRDRLKADALAKRMEGLVKQAKASIGALIRAGRTDRELSERERNLILKVDMIKYVEANGLEESCQGDGRNASYSSGTHTFFICPATMKFTDTTLMAVIGHELAHAIDPCRGNSSLLRVDHEKLQAMELPETKAKGLKEFLADYDLTTAGFLEQNVNIPKIALAALYKAGALVQVTQAGPNSTYPFSDVTTCLQNSNSVNFPSFEKDIEDYLKFARSQGVPISTIENARTYLNANPHCTPIAGRNSRMGETFADWVGSQVQADYLTKHGDPALVGLESVAFFASSACSHREDFAPESVREELDIVETLFSDEHPSNEARLADVFLKNPVVARFTGCTPKPGAECKYTPRAPNHSPGQNGGETKGIRE